MQSTATYPPLNRLKPVCRDVWIVDGPLIRFGPPWPKFSFPTRMTLVRIGADLFIHSPTELTPELIAEVKAIGSPRWLIGPNRLHYWWIPDWKQAFPEASVYVAPGVEEQAGRRLELPHLPLDRDHGYPWDARILTLPVVGSYLTEVVFFDRESRTLILTDLIQNFERRKLRSRALRWLTRLAGVQDPHGSTPRDMRLTWFRRKPQLRAAVRTMIDWAPERIILAHGRWYDRRGAEELRRAFGWLLDEAGA